MAGHPLILVTADTQQKGVEMQDVSSSLSERYQEAILQARGIPVIMPSTENQELIAECVGRVDGVMLTGGDDLNPRIYQPGIPADLEKRASLTPDGGRRDLRELLLMQEIMRQQKPLLAICRGHQVLNVALGGTLIVDLPTQAPGPINHKQMERRLEVVHEARLTPDSLLAKITGKPTLGVNSTHHQAVACVAPPLCVVARSPDGVVEGMELSKRAAHLLPFLISVQFHPERLVDRYAEHRAIFRAFVLACANGKKDL